MKKSLLLVALLLLVVATGVCTALGSADIVTQAEENSTTPTVTYVETEEDFLAFATNRYLASEGDKFILTSDIYLDRFYAESRTLKSLEYNSKNIAFNAIFDGRGHAVVGLKESLFSIIGESGVVKNLQLIGVNNVDNLTACSLAYTNNGTISGVEVSGDLQGSGFTAGLVQTNVGTIENCIVAVDMTGAKANDESVTYAYGLASGSGTITDSYGYGHGLGVTQGDEQVILGKSGLNTYTELNYTLAIGNPLKLGNALNLYNTPLISDANLELSIQNGYTLYNTDGLSSGVLENLEEFPAKTGTAELSNSTAPQGSGTKEDPYRISTPEELTYIDNFSSEDYAMLTAHIDLSAYTNTYFLSKLQCNFDGNGYTITLSVGSSGLAQSIYSEKSVEDYTELSDYMRVSDLFINAKLAQDVYSSVYNVTVKGNAVSFADVVWQNGVVMRSTLINHSESFVSTANKGMVAFNRFITDGGAPFANEGQVYGFYFATESSDTSEFLAMQGVEEAVMVDALSGEVLDYYGGDSELTLESKFGTADIYAWGYLYGQEKDIPKMVFPSDRAKYKSTLSLSGSYSYSDYVGTKKGTGEATITTLPVGTDTSVYATSNHDRVFTDSTLDYTNCYELLEADGATISKEAVEFIIKESLSSEVVTYLDNKTLTWNSIAGGEVTGAYFDSVGVYLLIYQDDVIYLCATLAVDNGGVAELSYEYIEEGVGNLKMLSNLNMQSILDSYENATVSYHLADGVTLAPTIISEVGSYVVKITIPSTTTTAGAVIKGEYTLNKGDFDFSGVTIASIGKGLSQDNATVYDGAEKDFLSELYYYGTEYQGITFSLNSIVSLEKQDGSFAYNLDSVVDAGKYTVLLNINVPGYNTITKTINFYVDRKAFAVDALYDGQSSVEFDYYTPFDGDKVSYYTSVADISLINFIENLSYDNYYYAGCNVGQYMITPVINASEIANNYDITAGVGALITVNPVKISLNPAKLSETLTYDGKEHVINVPEDAIIRNTTDTSAITYSVVGAVAKTSVGSYIQEIQVKLDSQNYLISDPCEATLTINPKPIKMGAKDAYVNYGEDAVYQAYAEVNDGVAIEENILEQIVLGTDYTLSSSYVVGETKAGGALPITLTLLNYTETAEGYLKGNYLIDKEIGVGALTVGKKSYAFDMETSYSYTGSPVALDFKGEIFDAEPSYKFYLLSGGNSYELGYTPTDACDSTYLYQVEVTVPESDSYYGATSEKITFAITPLDDTLSGLYVTAGGVTKPISEWSADVYSKTEYTISIDY
ncbi:MAG: hypothetical protein IJ033_00705, partial [Clostridia bacterium]|nr:hypothetical protein [Clostridia bacterium]